MLAVAAAMVGGVSLTLRAQGQESAAPASATNGGGTRIYWIGNSVTDALKYPMWEQTAEADGRKIAWGRMMIPGAPISWLWDHPADGITQDPYGPYSTYAVMYKRNPTGFSGSQYGVKGTAEKVIQQTVWDVVRANPLAGVSESSAAPAATPTAP
jgi:hypothetical protein